VDRVKRDEEASFGGGTNPKHIKVARMKQNREGTILKMDSMNAKTMACGVSGMPSN